MPSKLKKICNKWEEQNKIKFKKSKIHKLKNKIKLLRERKRHLFSSFSSLSEFYFLFIILTEIHKAHGEIHHNFLIIYQSFRKLNKFRLFGPKFLVWKETFIKI